MVADYRLETRRQILPSGSVRDLEQKPWVGQLLGFQGVSDLLLAVPEPFVELPLCEAGDSHQVAEVALVPFAVVLLEGLHQDLELLVGLAALGFAN